MSSLLIALIALAHIGFLWMEMANWPRMAKRLGLNTTPEFLEQTKVMAANQGVYNGFLAAGLIWSLVIGDPDWARNVAIFFLLCVAVAGAYGGWSVSKRIYGVQMAPALVALLLVLFS